MVATAVRVPVSVVWKPAPGAHISKKDAGIVGPELAQLCEEHGREIEAVEVVDAARPAASPLHRYFEWNDAKAAEQHRVNQARYFLRSIHVEIKRGEEAVWDGRGFISLTVEDVGDPEPQGQTKYILVSRAMEEEDKGEEAAERAHKELLGWRSRWEKYKALPGFAARLGEVFETLEPLLSRN